MIQRGLQEEKDMSADLKKVAGLLILAGGLVDMWACSVAAAERPNVVFILADDLGYGDIHAFGGDRCRIDTPHFDQLCAEGMKFTNAHATDSVCVPSRTSIMTGRYAFRFGPAESGGPWGFVGLRFPPQQHTLGDLFQSAGYRTGYVGKWHLGTRMATRDGRVQGPENTDFTQPIRTGPQDYGFDDCFFLPGSLDMFPYAFIRGREWQGAVTAQKGWSAFNRVGPAAADFEDVNVLSTFCDEAGQFIDRQAGSDTPFFLYVALTAPHTPTSPEAAFEGRSRIGVYGDFVMNTDACIGRIREHLRRTGTDRNTLVMVSSDHGPGHYSGRKREATANQMQEMQDDGHYTTGPWRGYKFSVFEGGLRVPFAAVWPAEIPAGTESDALIGLNDLMATWADLCGISMSDEQGPDSISFASVLQRGDQGTRQSMIIRGTRADAVIDGDWKLILGPGSGSAGQFASQPTSDEAWRTAISSAARKVREHADLEDPAFTQLYHLSVDPGETEDQSAADFARVQRMLGTYRRIVESGRSTAGPRLPNDRAIEAFRPPPFVWNK